MAKTAIIIGAGLGGMATAIRLAHAGWKVKVLEKNMRVGGKLSCAGENGFLWDVGPSLITMPFVLRDLFEAIGHDMEHYLELVPLNPICRYFFPDGKVLNAWADQHHFQIELARLEKDHGESLEAFMRYARGIYDLAGEAYLFPSSRGRFSARALKSLHHLPRALTRATMAQVIKRYFKNPKAQQFFLRYATHNGSSPYLASATFNMVSYIERRDGGWYIRGGIYRLAEALEKCACDLGVEFLLDAEVSEIALRSRGRFSKPRATGALLRSGLRFEGDAVICNTDFHHAWTRLLQKRAHPRAIRRLERQALSSSPFVILWGVKQRFEKLSHHNVFFSSDYPAEFDDIFKKKRPPEEPTIYVGISARSDPTQAPEGQDNYFVLVHTPALEPDHHWDQLRGPYRNRVLDRLEKMGLEGLRRHIVCERVITPSDFAARTNAYRGSIYGAVSHSRSSVLRRPSHRSAEVNGLYFVGGTVRPGGGIPLVLLSARDAAETVISDSEKEPHETGEN